MLRRDQRRHQVKLEHFAFRNVYVLQGVVVHVTVPVLVVEVLSREVLLHAVICEERRAENDIDLVGLGGGFGGDHAVDLLVGHVLECLLDVVQVVRGPVVVLGVDADVVVRGDCGLDEENPGAALEGHVAIGD